jgi:hypothetical protein
MYFFSPIVFNVRCEAIATPFYASVVFELLVGKRAVIVVRSVQLPAHAFRISRQPQNRRTDRTLPSRNRSRSRESYDARGEALCVENNSAMREWAKRLS